VGNDTTRESLSTLNNSNKEQNQDFTPPLASHLLLPKNNNIK